MCFFFGGGDSHPLAKRRIPFSKIVPPLPPPSRPRESCPPSQKSLRMYAQKQELRCRRSELLQRKMNGRVATGYQQLLHAADAMSHRKEKGRKISVSLNLLSQVELVDGLMPFPPHKCINLFSPREENRACYCVLNLVPYSRLFPVEKLGQPSFLH